jgi:hypothetical protein
MITIGQRYEQLQSRLHEMFGERITDGAAAEEICFALAAAERSSAFAHNGAFEWLGMCVFLLMAEFNLTEPEIESFFSAVKLNGRPVS